MQRIRRQATCSDMIILARGILREKPQWRYDKAVDFVNRAVIANETLKQTGQTHAVYGDGTIMTAVLNTRDVPPEPSFENADFRHCLTIAMQVMDEHLSLAAREAA